MAVDLTGLGPVRERSRQVMEQAFLPTGGVPEEELNRAVQRQLWGTGTTPGIYSQMARRGLSELQPETMYSSSKAVSDSIQQLADQYASRQRAGIETARLGELTEPIFRLNEANVTGMYAGQPTMAREQMDIDKLLREAGLTGTYGGVPTLASKQLTQQESQFGRSLASQENLARLNRELQMELQKGDLASREKIAQLQADIQREQLALQQGIALGAIGGAPTLANVLGKGELDIRGQEAATRSKQLEEELNWRQNMLLGSMAGSLAERSGLMDWLFGSQEGRPGGTGTGGTGGTGGVVSGVLKTAAKKAWDLLTGAATSAPYLSTAPLSAEAAQIASQLVAQGIPQNIAFEAANATAVEGLSPAGESISNFLASFSSASAPAAGVAAGVGPAAPSIEAGLIEMLGPELAAQLGYTAAPAAAGLAGANIGAGLTPAAVEAMTGLSTGAGTGMTVGAGAGAAGAGATAGGVAGGMGGAAGAELGGMAAGSMGAGGMGALAAGGALALPALAGMIVMSTSPGGNFKPAYDTAANSLVPKLASYEAQQLGAEILGGQDPLVQAVYPGMSGQLPVMDRLAAADAIAAKIGFGQDAYDAARVVAAQVPGYTNVRPVISTQLARIMARENRYPTQEEFVRASVQAVNAGAQAAWQQTVDAQMSEGKYTIDMVQPPQMLSVEDVLRRSGIQRDWQPDTGSPAPVSLSQSISTNPMLSSGASTAFRAGPDAVLAWLKKIYPGEDFTTPQWGFPGGGIVGPALPAGPMPSSSLVQLAQTAPPVRPAPAAFYGFDTFTGAAITQPPDPFGR